MVLLRRRFSRFSLGALLVGVVLAVVGDPGGAGRRRIDLDPPTHDPETLWIWISPDEIAALPDAGAAFEELLDEADEPFGVPNLADERDRTNVRLLAKAYAYVRTGVSSYRDGVIDGAFGAMGSEGAGRTLGLGRNLLAVVIAAQLVGLDSTPWGAYFSEWLDAVRHQELLDGRSLVETHEERPNNWGTHAGASRMAADLYLRDTDDFARAVQVFQGYLGDRSAWSGFEYGLDLSWHADPANPVPINPLDALLLGQSVDGVLPDDQRRAGPFQWPPPLSNYPYGALQGAVAQALILHRRGHDAWSWQDGALLRAFRWLDEQLGAPIQGDDQWLGHVVNRFYGTAFPAPIPANPGKNMAWTDWTHPSP